jgi:hypothetical protein
MIVSAASTSFPGQVLENLSSAYVVSYKNAEDAVLQRTTPVVLSLDVQ